MKAGYRGCIPIRKLSGLLILLCVATSGMLRAAEDQLPVWKVSSGQAEVVLLGSVHLAYPDVYPLRQEIQQAFADADTLVVEVDVGGPNAFKLQQMMLQRGTLPTGESLADQLSGPVWEKLVAYIESRGLPLELFLQLRPGLVMVTLSTMRMVELGMKPELGIDRYFLEMARGLKPIVELETAQQQVDLLLSFPDDDLLIEQTLLQLEEIERYLQPIYEAWQAGDEKALNHFLLEDELAREPRFKPIYEAMFDDRNYAMTDKISAYLGGSGRYFVVVGAGHLVGEKGIVSLLEKRGFKAQKF
jgi:uncharacterized protein YbaP (TraB family)